MPRPPQLADQRRRRRADLGGVLDDQDHHLGRRQRRGEPEAEVVAVPHDSAPTSRVDTPHEVCHTYSSVPDALA